MKRQVELLISKLPEVELYSTELAFEKIPVKLINGLPL